MQIQLARQKRSWYSKLLPMASTDNTIVVEKLTKSFKKLKVLKGVDLTVQRGTVSALLGPNGAGKTTMIRIMSTLLLPDSGKVLIDGHNVVEKPEKVRSIIGLTGQYAAVDEYLTGAENMEMMGRLYRLSITDAKARAQELLKKFQLDEAAKRVVKTYSGGMRRRLDLAISLIATPPIIFLDEPTTGLDPRSRLTMWEIIDQLVKEEGVTILLTTQYMEEADRLADKITVIDQGKVIAEGTSDQLKQKIGNERLELTIAKSSNFETVKALVKEEVVKDSEKRTLVVPLTNGVSEVKQILDQMSSANVEIESLSLHKPTLDDVFLTLTGHSVTEGGADSKEGTK
jgi:ABC-2 type transport system ATP-binding protein